jgi:uncharacterized protein DUF6152
MMKRHLSGVILLAAAPLLAHHSFPAEFDGDKPLKLQGIVKKVEWVNPHSWITIEVKGADGAAQTWEIEAGAPNALFRRGFSRDSLPVGTEIVVNGYQAKNGSQRANGRDLTLPDGRKLFMGSSAPDAPDKGK